MRRESGRGGRCNNPPRNTHSINNNEQNREQLFQEQLEEPS